MNDKEYKELSIKEFTKASKKIIENSTVEVVCTGHSGIWDHSPKIFAHFDESARSSIGRPFDPSAPKSIRK